MIRKKETLLNSLQNKQNMHVLLFKSEITEICGYISVIRKSSHKTLRETDVRNQHFNYSGGFSNAKSII